MPLKISKPWWLADTYDLDMAVPPTITDLAGPQGVALVRLWANGTTSRGWGLVGKDGEEGFMPRYAHGEFNARRVLYGYDRDKWAFAFVMRSLNLVAIDIDGKNGGIEHAEELLGGAVPTLAETSKSGNGYHLFYSTDEMWDAATGFGHELADHIGIVQGVDIRATGCVYHHKPQRWNGRPIAPLPAHIAERLQRKAEQREAARSIISSVLELEEIEVLMLHEELLAELAKPIRAGSRNNTLFAIGSKLKAADVPDWAEKVRERAHQVGLDWGEAEKITANIEAYA